MPPAVPRTALTGPRAWLCPDGPAAAPPARLCGQNSLFSCSQNTSCFGNLNALPDLTVREWVPERRGGKSQQETNRPFPWRNGADSGGVLVPRPWLCLHPRSFLPPSRPAPSRSCAPAYLAKLARFWVTLAMRVKVRAVRSSGYSCRRLKRDGDMMAGQRNRRNREALISRSLMSGRPRLLHSCLHEAKTSLSSLGKTLKRQKDMKGW